jgi:hypothetical protein
MKSQLSWIAVTVMIAILVTATVLTAQHWLRWVHSIEFHQRPVAIETSPEGRLADPYHRVAIIGEPPAETLSFAGSQSGQSCEVAGVVLCWCSPGRFTMGSPPDEPERRPGEDQVEVTLTQGFWIGKYEVTQGQWRRVAGEFPGELTAGAGDDFPVYAVNFAEAEDFCRKLTEQGRAAGELPADWEFRLPTEARPSAAIRPIPGACTMCTATSSSGAETGITPACPAAWIPTCMPRGKQRW